MTTKDYCLCFKDKQDIFVDNKSDSQYDNLNLNQNHQFEKTLCPKSVTRDDRKVENYDVEIDYFSQARKVLNPWNKSTKHLPSFLDVDGYLKEKNDIKKAKSINDSTLSLHIAAYENLAEATTDSDSDVKESLEIKDEKSGLIRKWERSKHFCTGSKAIVQNLFELPRQQEEVRSKVTEIIKFKASQKLLNPNVNEKNVIQDQKALFKAFDKQNTMQALRSEFDKKILSLFSEGGESLQKCVLSGGEPFIAAINFLSIASAVFVSQRYLNRATWFSIKGGRTNQHTFPHDFKMQQKRLFTLNMLRNHAFARSVHSSMIISHRSFSSYSSDEYQFLQKSVIPTYHFQKSLRRLPIPKLEDSARRYLNAAKAVVSDAEFNESEAAVKELLHKDGPDLQKELLAYDKKNKHTSYISEPWFDMYLKSRLPCPINFNPFMMFAPEKDASYNDQLSRATNFAISCARFKKALDAEILAPEVFHMNPKKSDTDFFRTVCRLLPSNLSWFGAVAFKAFPLDMSQYTSLFGGNRIPARNKDILHNCKNPKHFMVMSKGNIYSVDLFDEQGNILPPDDVHASLAEILKSSTAPDTNRCIGSLTTLERDSWADIRNQLITDPKNRASFRSIDDALFVLCLDDLKTEDHGRLVQSLLCGDDGRNRWFDKCFQLIVDGNGQATVNFEHSWGDGVAVLRLMEETLRDTSTHHFVKPNQTVTGNPKVQKLEFEINDSLKNKIKKAQEDHIDRCKDLQFATVEYTNMTRDTIKSYKLSPDSVMQLAIQLAFYKVYNGFVPTYESCSTAAFKKGRTECIRSSTIATRDTVLAIEGKKPGNIKDLIKQSSDVHYELVKEASMGQGFDRHLLGIKMTAERLGRPIPALYSDKTYNYMGQFVLSTSTLSTDTIVFGGFGPVVPNGFGIGYNVAGSKMGAVISSYQSKRDAAKFAKAIAESLDTIHYHLKN